MYAQGLPDSYLGTGLRHIEARNLYVLQSIIPRRVLLAVLSESHLRSCSWTCIADLCGDMQGSGHNRKQVSKQWEEVYQ
jgi:hypothetical protein